MRRATSGVLAAGETPEPRLRLDMVAVDLVRRLEDAPRDAIPDGTTVVVTVTAPIKLAAKTAASLEETIAALLARRRRSDFEVLLHGGPVCVRIVTSATGTRRFIGFVHNPDPGADLSLLDRTEAELRAGRYGTRA